ncbi:MAG TPA: MarR family transcriptional regulator [Pseudonocardiaceae bacterium]
MTLTKQQRTATAEALDEVIRFAVRQMGTLRRIGVSAGATLARLDTAGPCRITALADHEGISQPSMTGIVSRLELQGLVERQRDPSDGRIVLVAITDAGRDVLRCGRAGRVAFLASLMGALDAEEQRALADATVALRHMADPAATPAALTAATHVMDQGAEYC